MFAPNSQHRAVVTPAKRGNGNNVKAVDEVHDKTSAERRASMTWAQRLKRVFDIDIEICQACGGPVRIIACIEDPAVIEKILTYMADKAPPAKPVPLPGSRAPLQARLFD